jgi:hypothetical protein
MYVCSEDVFGFSELSEEAEMFQVLTLQVQVDLL